MAQLKRFLIDNKIIKGYEDMPMTGDYDLFNIPVYDDFFNNTASTQEFIDECIAKIKAVDFTYQCANEFNSAVNYALLNANNEQVGSLQIPRFRIAKVTAAAYVIPNPLNPDYAYTVEYAMKADWNDYPSQYNLGLTDTSIWIKFDVVCQGFTNHDYGSAGDPTDHHSKMNVEFVDSQPIVATKGNTSKNWWISKTICNIDSYVNPTGYVYNGSSYGLLKLITDDGTLLFEEVVGHKSVLAIHVLSKSTSNTDVDYLVLNGNLTGSSYWGRFSISGDRINIDDVVNLDGLPIPEEGYMNELMNRFSPRYWAGSLGIYLIGTDDIADVMQAMMEIDVSDVLAQKFFGSDGKEYIMGLRWYYGLLQASGHTNGEIHMSASKMEVKVGTVKLDLNNVPIYEHIASSEFATWTSSELSVPAHFNNYLDFMSRYQLYIPYYGFLDITANDIVGGTIQLIYNINLVSGMADIVVACKNSRTNNLKTKYYTVSAKIGIDIPYGSDMIKTMSVAWAQTCGKAFATGATIGSSMAAASAMENVSQANTALSNVNLDTEEGRQAANNIVKNRDASQAEYNRAQFAKSTIGDINAKSVDTPHRSGGTNDEAGSLDELHPYLLITRPVSVEPSNYEDYVGVPSAASKKLSTCSGFTQIAAVKPEALTNAPKYVNEIISLLQAGVYL